MQVVAPVSLRVSVIEPGAQSAHWTCELDVYLPATHAVQDDPPVSFSVLVTEPGLQTPQVVVDVE